MKPDLSNPDWEPSDEQLSALWKEVAHKAEEETKAVRNRLFEQISEEAAKIGSVENA